MSETYAFDPHWDMIYRPFAKRMGENPRMMMQQMDATNQQVYAMTRVIVALQQELHELHSRLEALEKTNTIVANTADDTPKRGPGRPRKESDE